MGAVGERLAAGLTAVGPRAGVNARVSVQIAAVLEALSTHVADEPALVAVYPGVLHQVPVRVEQLPARRALERLLSAVRARVVVQLGARHEALPADVTDEHPDAGVDPLVFADGAPLEESLLADRARVRTVPGMRPAMGSQARAGQKAPAADVADERTVGAVVQALVTAHVGPVPKRLAAGPARGPGRRAGGPRTSFLGVDAFVLPEGSRGQTSTRTDAAPMPLGLRARFIVHGNRSCCRCCAVCVILPLWNDRRLAEAFRSKLTGTDSRATTASVFDLDHSF